MLPTQPLLTIWSIGMSALAFGLFVWLERLGRLRRLILAYVLASAVLVDIMLRFPLNLISSSDLIKAIWLVVFVQLILWGGLLAVWQTQAFGDIAEREADGRRQLGPPNDAKGLRRRLRFNAVEIVRYHNASLKERRYSDSG